MGRLWIALGIWLCAAPLWAGQTTYDLKIRGFHVGVMTLSAEARGESYALAGQIKNTGLLRVFRSFRYQGSAQGRLTAAGPRSLSYSENAHTGKRVAEVEMRFKSGLPQVLHMAPPPHPEAEVLEPASLGGTVDPLSGIYALLGDTTPEKACKLDVQLFDGQRLSRIVMQPAGSADGLPLCKGQYLRLKGYSPEEIARHTVFPFTMTYQGAGDMLQVKHLKFKTDYGQAEILRR